MFVVIIPLKDLINNKIFGDQSFNHYNLKSQLTEFYSYGPFKPAVEISDDFVTIAIDDDTINKQDEKYRKAVSFCEKGRYADAMPILANLIKANPRNSEYNRLQGQILSMTGKQDEAIQYLIEAIKWDYNNHWAFIMLGNIYAKYFNDLDKAMLYYDRALKINPKDNILLNNIGANYAQREQNDKAMDYFEKAMKADSGYPNTYYGIALIHFRNKDFKLSFDYSVECMRHCKDVNELYQQAAELAFEIATIYIGSDENDMLTVHKVIDYIKGKTGFNTKIEIDDSLPTAAKVQIAENYGRDYHLVTYNSNYPAYQHLLIHELTHVLFSMKARDEGSNKLFTVNEAQKTKFLEDNKPTLDRLTKKGYPSSQVIEFLKQFYLGLTNQLFNTPVDLFIEDFIYETYPEIRPYQMVSLRSVVKSGVDACTSKKAIDLSPTKQMSNSKILNYVIASQYEDLYGVKMKELIMCDYSERKRGDEMYAMYKEAKQDFVPGHEYELIDKVGKMLRLTPYYNLVDEDEYRKKNPVKPEKTEPQGDENLNMAVVMYILSALQAILKMSHMDIKQIAFEIAEIGKSGIDPHDPELRYDLKTYPDKQFTGLQLLSWMFVTWKTVEPTLDTGLKYEREYETAMQMMGMSVKDERD